MSNEVEPQPRRRGNLIVVSAPSGAGKSSLVKNVLGRVPQLRYSVSWTTRPARGSERAGIDYHFVSKQQFDCSREDGGFLEWAEVHGNLYGTPAAPVEQMLSQGEDVILDIDVQGASQMRQRVPDAVTIFVLPPSRAVLEARLRSRDQDPPEEIARRLRNAAAEVREFEKFDYLIVNDDLERASAALETIILAERHRLSKARRDALAIVDTFGGESVHA